MAEKTWLDELAADAETVERIGEILSRTTVSSNDRYLRFVTLTNAAEIFALLFAAFRGELSNGLGPLNEVQLMRITGYIDSSALLEPLTIAREAIVIAIPQPRPATQPLMAMRG